MHHLFIVSFRLKDETMDRFPISDSWGGPDECECAYVTYLTFCGREKNLLTIHLYSKVLREGMLFPVGYDHWHVLKYSLKQIFSWNTNSIPIERDLNCRVLNYLTTIPFSLYLIKEIIERNKSLLIKNTSNSSNRVGLWTSCVGVYV